MKETPNASRYWLLEINNPLDHGFDRETIVNVLNSGAKMKYFCISDEVGEQGTPHVHFYVCWVNNMRFESLKNKFPCAHIDYPRGTPQECRDYVFKEGKWLDDKKSETNIRDSHYEWGEIPENNQGKRTDLEDLYQMIKEGKSNYQIFEENPNFIRMVDKIDRIRTTLVEEQSKNRWRDVSVTYVWGKTGTGKTRSIMEKYGYQNVYRVTDYKNPFDGYKGQQVILFEEFRSSLKIEDMLKYLDGYPVELTCRYANKQAEFTEVYFASNIDLKEQYPNIQEKEPETWNAFLRRIDRVKRIDAGWSVTVSTEEYLKNVQQVFENPFDHEWSQQEILAL